jgi:hypothetical protein
MKIITPAQLDQLSCSDEYAEYIMNNCGGDRIICNGDTLTDAMEQQYLLDEFVESLGFLQPV